MTRASVVTQLFHRLPEFVQTKLRKIFKMSNILLLFRFYYGQDNILREKGWFASERRNFPVNDDGDPIPWYTYSMIDFLEGRLNDEFRVFEYGGGFSTLWYADKVRNVIAVDTSKKWAEIVTQRLPDNGKIIHKSSKEHFIHSISDFGEFDIIVIDGPYRPDCIEPSLEAISDGGVIIWDDFEWVEENQYKHLVDEGFSFIPFYGLKPLGANYNCTAIFYRGNNCLGV